MLPLAQWTRRTRRLGLAGMLAVTAAGCGPSTGGHFGGTGGVTLIVLPTEGDIAPQLVAALDSDLHDAKVSGVTRTRSSKVSIEVVQLSIGCVDMTPICYRAVAKSLAAQELLFARVDPPDPRHHKQLKVTVSLFDAIRGGLAGEAARYFASEDEAAHDVGKLVEAVVDPNAHIEAEAP